MNQESLLKLIADTGYNAGFGAKKHFASYDMIEKLQSKAHPAAIGHVLQRRVMPFFLVFS